LADQPGVERVVPATICLSNLRGRHEPPPGRSRPSKRVPCLEMTRALITDRIVGVAGAIAAGIGLWRFTSGAWIQGIVFALAVAILVAYTLLRYRRRGRDTRRY
jgi:hypothetical protein